MTPPTRIFYDARTLRPGMTGVGRYALELLRGLNGLGAEVARVRALILRENLEAAAADPALAGVEWVPTGIDYQSHPWGDLGLEFAIPRLVAKDEIYHGPAYVIPGRGAFGKVSTVHDLGTFKRPQDYPGKFGAYMRWSIRRALASADRVVVPSRVVADDVAELFPQFASKVSVTYEAPCGAGLFASGASVGEDVALPSAPYFACVGSVEARKDPATVARALGHSAAAGFHVVWLGGAAYKGEEIMREIAGLPSAGRFHFTGFRERAAVERALAGSLGLIYPSLDEGFGLPPLEAMAAGKPVIVSDLPVLREVCGDAALYFPVGDDAALAGLMRRIAEESAEERATRRARGIQRAGEFTWGATAGGTLKAYQEIERPVR